MAGVTESAKHYGLLLHGIHYGRKKFYSTGFHFSKSFIFVLFYSHFDVSLDDELPSFANFKLFGEKYNKPFF
jgi:hypothetical protein